MHLTGCRAAGPASLSGSAPTTTRRPAAEGGSTADRIDVYLGTGNAFSVASGRLSYVLGLQGPAWRSIRHVPRRSWRSTWRVRACGPRECDLRAGRRSQPDFSPEHTIYFSKLRALSADGRCKTFDAAANGYGRGEGCGMVVLKRLSDAAPPATRVLGGGPRFGREPGRTQ